MAKELALDQILGNRGAVDTNKGLVFPIAIFMECPRYELLACTAFTRNENRRGGVGNSFDDGIDLVHLGRASHHSKALTHGVVDRTQILFFGGDHLSLVQAILLRRLGDDLFDLVSIERFCNEIEGTCFNRPYSPVHRPEGGDQNNRDIWALASDLLKESKAVHTWHFEVRDDHRDRFPAQYFQGFDSISGCAHGIAGATQECAKYLSKVHLIINNKDGFVGGYFHFRGHGLLQSSILFLCLS